MFTLGNRYVSTPSPNTLKSMFGDTKPISYFAETEYKEKMSKALSIEEKITAICDYAKELHNAQYEYDQISPYGGYDVTVQSIDEIALNEVLRLFDGEALQEACSLLRTKLFVRNVRLSYTEDIIESYQKLQKMPQQLEKQYADYQLAKADFAKKVNEKVIEISKHCESEYSKYEQQFNEIHNSPVKRFLSKIPWSRTYKELTSISESMGNALLDSNVSEQYVIENFFEEDEIPSAPFYWTPINSDEPDMKVIKTESDLNLAIAEIREQLMNQDNKDAYIDCQFLYNSPILCYLDKEKLSTVKESQQKSNDKTPKRKDNVVK